MIDWFRLTRGIGQDDIDAAVDAAKALPDSGDSDHVDPPWPKADTVPDVHEDDWAAADSKQLKIKKLQASTMRLDRSNLIWHIQNPNKSKFQSAATTHPRVVKQDGENVIVDGHHRLAALLMLGVDKEQVWRLKQ